MVHKPIFRNIWLTALALCTGTMLLAAPFAIFNHKVFHIPGKGSVVETYLDFQGRSVHLKPNGEGMYFGMVEVTLIFRQGDVIAAYDKKELQSPLMAQNDFTDFIDVQRFALPSGKYLLEIHLQDLHADEHSTAQMELEIEVPALPEGVSISDIQIVSAYKKTDTPTAFSKSGYDLLPMVSDDFLNPDMKEVVLYCEIYGTAANEGLDMFLLETHLAAADGTVLENTRKLERRKSSDVVPVMVRMDIAEVRSGDYQLVVEVRDKSNEQVARKGHPTKRIYNAPPREYQDVNPESVAASWVNRYKSKAELYEHIRSLRPISEDREVFIAENTLRDFHQVQLVHLQQFFYNFWDTRDAIDPEGAWIRYKEKVDFVNENFRTRNKRGYETDRGRVYLRYGPPVDIVDRANEPNSYPYQIWRYYKADRWNNVRFVFFDPTLTRMDYELIHCEYIPGELMNPQWRLVLQQRTTPVIGVDDRNPRDSYGSRVDDFFDNPR